MAPRSPIPRDGLVGGPTGVEQKPGEVDGRINNWTNFWEVQF
jgi:hypothetical protein